VPLQNRSSFAPSDEPCDRFSPDGTYITSAFQPIGWIPRTSPFYPGLIALRDERDKLINRVTELEIELHTAREELEASRRTTRAAHARTQRHPDDSMTTWPEAVDAAAFHGPAGEFVLRTEPHTEADPMALLM